MTIEVRNRTPATVEPVGTVARASPRKRRASSRRVWAMCLIVLLMVTAGIALSSMRWWRHDAGPDGAPGTQVQATTQTPTSCDGSGPPSRTTVCFGAATSQVGHGVLNLVGYFGSPSGKGVGGARVELLGSARAGSPLGPTGMQTVTDGSGRFAFAVITTPGSVRYAFRFAANGFYPSTASEVLTVTTSR